MKIFKKIMIVLAISTISTLVNIARVEAQASVSYQVFYDDLSPYGQWVPDQEFGYVWMPANVAGFSPYGTAGHWVLTDFGWTWVSDYPWGWAPFHYGRWRYNDFYGWQWIPGNEWGPAWVSWRRARGYYGWAPLSPGVSVNVAIGSHYNAPHEHWVFVQERYINNPRLVNYYAPANENITIIKNSTVINNTYIDKSRNSTYIAGPHRDEVQKITGSPVKSVAIKESGKPGQSVNNNELNIYRPTVSKADVKGNNTAPRKVTELKDVKTINGKQPPAEQNTKSNTKQQSQPVKSSPNSDNNNTDKGHAVQNDQQQSGEKAGTEHKQQPNVKDPNKKPHNQPHHNEIKKADPPKQENQHKEN
ncbi:MAG: DUF6600 domain-containing protein [Bacteroidia bacterium]